MAEVEMTEFTALEPEELHLVKRGANGFPPLLAKAVADEIVAAQADVDTESDEIEDELTKGLCGVDGCEVCAPVLVKAKLKAKTRNALPAGAFALPKEREYPIHDKSHADNALSRASGKPEEAQVRAAVHRRYPNIGAEKSPGVPAFATATPKEGGHVRDTGVSGKRVAPMVTGTKLAERITIEGGENPAVGGSATQVIPAESRVVHPPSAHLTAKTAYAFSSLAQFMDQVSAQREGRATKDAPWLAQPNDSAATEPGSGPWESYDSASLKEVAANLAACGKAIDAIQKREAVEAISNPGDARDAMDLLSANSALDCALGIVARLAFVEGAAKQEDLEKAGWQFSSMSTTTLSAARDQLTSVLEARHFAAQSGAMEADEIMTTLTKEELDQKIKDGAAAALKDSMKKERKALKKQLQVLQEALKNANNKGDISQAEIRNGVTAHVDADDVNAIPDGGKVKAEYANKAEEEKAKKAEKKAAKKAAQKSDLAEIKELVSKMAKQPRPGGPNLTGTIPPGFVPAGEGRQDEAAVKSAEDGEIERLTKELEKAKDHKGPDGMQRVQDVSIALTRAQLRQGHRRGEV